MHLRKLADLFLVGILALTISFCSSGDNSTGPGSTRNIDFENYDDLVKDILPDAYVTAQTSGANRAPFEIDPLWNEGEESILNKVLGEDHSQSVFYYLEQFDMTINDLEGLLQVDDSGNLYADTSWMRLYDLSSPTTVPTEAQPVIGATVDVEHWIDVEFEGDPEGKINHIGFTQNADEEIILLYNYWPLGQFSAEGESWIFYARYDKSDSSIVMKGMDFKDEGGGVSARNVFDVQTVNRSDFAYRMSWFSNEDPEMESLLGCIVGGGNKDTEFALRYRQFMPADAEAPDSTYLLEQVFNADYSESASLITSYDDFIDEDLIFRYEDMPTQHLPSPWQE
jgi:hypothetical protein